MNRGERSLVCSIRGPVMLIAIGVLFALGQFTPYGFHLTWPVLLILLGVLKLLERAPGGGGQAGSTPQTGVTP
jgi:hypothetical protein